MVDLTNADVADILALLDSLPYDSLDVETPRFRLTLRRAPDGGWTEGSQVLAEPAQVTAAPNGASVTAPVTSGFSEMSGGAGGTGALGSAGTGDPDGAAGHHSEPGGT